MTKLPSYQDWEYFWNAHLTAEYRAAMLRTIDSQCNSFASIDSLRGFFAKLAGNDGNAPMPDSLNRVYAALAVHLIETHELPQLTSEELTDEVVKQLQPVMQTLADYAELGIDMLIVVPASESYSTLN